MKGGIANPNQFFCTLGPESLPYNEKSGKGNLWARAGVTHRKEGDFHEA
jgi:hypothetical protein